MHELGVVIEVVKTVRRFVRQHQLTQVDTIVLQIGELSSMIPRYVKECFPAAVDQTEFAQTKLVIEIVPAKAICKGCQQVFSVLHNSSTCPECGSQEWGLLSGREFSIKEIIAR
ncbi:MAG TPA: hydrogenase nickel incorporation protein HypA [Vibrio sp.]|nr:hydrogenase nickel incorporation protein HypA [Vibrio sp.]